MTDRELRRLSRTDLLELLLAQRRENEQLRCLLDQAQAQLADRTIEINKAGSIAEASLQLNGVFQAAEASCQHYIDNIKLLSARQDSICQEMEAETKAKCDQMIAEAEQKSQQCWDVCSTKLQQFIDSFEGLQQVMEIYSSINKSTGRSAPHTESSSHPQITGTLY